MTLESPPDLVLVAFGLRGTQPTPLGAGWEGGWRCGEVVLSMVADHARAAWSAKVRETLFIDGIRLARPVRSTDGRFVVAGWRADTFVAGTPEPRHDEVAVFRRSEPDLRAPCLGAGDELGRVNERENLSRGHHAVLIDQAPHERRQRRPDDR